MKFGEHDSVDSFDFVLGMAIFGAMLTGNWAVPVGLALGYYGIFVFLNKRS